VIHRDIKPSNILLGNRSGNSIGDVYLVDFGSVQTVAKKEEGTITIVGSYGYIPLEQFGGQTTTASDLYSLGMTLIYLLTGTHPAELPQVDGRVKFNAEISKRFERWLEKMTYPHLDKRFDSAKVAQLALKSEDGSYGDFVHLKPTDTQVRLYRDRDRLEIIWKDKNHEQLDLVDYIFKIFSRILLALFALFFLVSLLRGISIASTIISAFISLIFIPTIVPVLVALLSWIIKLFISDMDYHLMIDDLYIHKSKKRNRKSKPIMLSEHPRSQIEILAYNPGYTFDKCLDTNGKFISGSTITIPPKLYLYCRDFEYSFPARSTSTQFSQAELRWLGQELSDFLNLELKVMYPTPQVPPAPSCGGGC
jgi:serine/threonine protein kinase